MNSKEYYINLIDLMVGLTPREIERLEQLELEEIFNKYNMLSLEKSDEMLE